MWWNRLVRKCLLYANRRNLERHCLAQRQIVCSSEAWRRRRRQKRCWSTSHSMATSSLSICRRRRARSADGALATWHLMTTIQSTKSLVSCFSWITWIRHTQVDCVKFLIVFLLCSTVSIDHDEWPGTVPSVCRLLLIVLHLSVHFWMTVCKTVCVAIGPLSVCPVLSVSWCIVAKRLDKSRWNLA